MTTKLTITDRYEEFKQYATDAKGRVFGYTAVITEMSDGATLACVQKCVKTRDGYKSWGAAQRSKKFSSTKEARRWAFATQKERGAKLCDGRPA